MVGGGICSSICSAGPPRLRATAPHRHLQLPCRFPAQLPAAISRPYRGAGGAGTVACAVARPPHRRPPDAPCTRPRRGHPRRSGAGARPVVRLNPIPHTPIRSEEHTSELQSQSNLVCRLLLEKKKIFRIINHT